MAPGLGNGAWKWLLSCAYSTLYRLGFFMWQSGCWDIHPRGCTLIKDSSSGHFCTVSCGHWPPFHPWACSYTAALLPGLPVTPSNTLGVVTWLEWLLTWLASWDPSLPDGGLVGMIIDHVRVTFPPQKWRLCPWAIDGRVFRVDSVKTSCQKWPNLCVILKQYSHNIIHVEKVCLSTVKLNKSSIIFYNGRAAWMDRSRIITLLCHQTPWAFSAAISSMLWFILATTPTSLWGAPKGDLKSWLGS